MNLNELHGLSKAERDQRLNDFVEQSYDPEHQKRQLEKLRAELDVYEAKYGITTKQLLEGALEETTADICDWCILADLAKQNGLLE